MSQFDKRNISMMMDLYEMTMADCYFAEKDEETQVVFDVFYRKNPDQGGFAIFAGLEQIVEYIEDLHFDEDDISYFSSLHLFSEEFLQYLKISVSRATSMPSPKARLCTPMSRCLPSLLL